MVAVEDEVVGQSCAWMWCDEADHPPSPWHPFIINGLAFESPATKGVPYTVKNGNRSI